MAAAMEIDEEEFGEASTSQAISGDKPGNKKRFEVKKVSPTLQNIHFFQWQNTIFTYPMLIYDSVKSSLPCK